MAQGEARAFLLNILDRAAAVDRPFWEVSAGDREALTVLLGTPTAAMNVLRGEDGELRVEGAADLFLATAILAEVALQLAQEGAVSRTREEAVFELRERLSILLR